MKLECFIVGEDESLKIRVVNDHVDNIAHCFILMNSFIYPTVTEPIILLYSPSNFFLVQWYLAD